MRGRQDAAGRADGDAAYDEAGSCGDGVRRAGPGCDGEGAWVFWWPSSDLAWDWDSAGWPVGVPDAAFGDRDLDRTGDCAGAGTGLRRVLCEDNCISCQNAHWVSTANFSNALVVEGSFGFRAGA